MGSDRFNALFSLFKQAKNGFRTRLDARFRAYKRILRKLDVLGSSLDEQFSAWGVRLTPIIARFLEESGIKSSL
jgi:hypothetical protein